MNAAEIEQILWQVMQILHREYFSVDISADLTLKLLLFKQLSERSQRKEGKEFSVPKEAQWSAVQEEQHNIGQQLSRVLAAVEKSNPNLGKLFIDSKTNLWTQFSDSTLLRVLQLFSKLNFSNGEATDWGELGKASEAFLEKIASHGRASQGRIYNPQQLSSMMVEMLDPEQGTSIYDPVCGSGEFLVKAAQFIKKSGGDLSQTKLYGQGRTIQDYENTKINLILNEVETLDIRLGNVIIAPQFIQTDKLTVFDIIVTNPPFRSKLSAEELANINYPERFRYGVPRNGICDFLFIQDILSSLKKTGKAAVVLSRGVLFRGGDEGKIRRRIVEDDWIEAVITLAPKLFYHTSIPVVVIIFNKNKPNKGKILFVDASSEYKAEKGRNLLQPEHIDHILSTYRNFEEEAGFSRLVSIEEIAENKYDLSVDSYIIFHSNAEFDITSEVSNLRQLEAERTELEGKIDDSLRALGIKI